MDCRQFRILEELIKVGSTIAEAELQQRCHMSHTTITPILNELEKQGLITIHCYGATKGKFSLIKANFRNKKIQALKKFYFEG